MTPTRESVLDQLAEYVARNRVLSKQITQFLKKVDCSTAQPTFFKSEGLSVLVHPEPQPDGKFRVKVTLHSLSPDGEDDNGFQIGLVTEDGQRISGRNRGRGHTSFESVPAGTLTLENWSVMRGREECYNRDTLLGYVQNGLTPEESRIVRAHLHFCRDCTRLVEGIEQEIAAVGAFIWPLQWLKTRAQQKIESVRTDARTTLKEMGKWLKPLLIAEPQLVPATQTRSRAQEIPQVPLLEARILDESGHSTGESLSLFVERPPQITRGEFRVTLSTPHPGYQGYTLSLALQNENGHLELCSIPFRERSGKCTATAIVPVRDLFDADVEQIPGGYIPIEFLDVSLQPR